MCWVHQSQHNRTADIHTHNCVLLGFSSWDIVCVGISSSVTLCVPHIQQLGHCVCGYQQFTMSQLLNPAHTLCNRTVGIQQFCYVVCADSAVGPFCVWISSSSVNVPTAESSTHNITELLISSSSVMSQLLWDSAVGT